MKVTTIGPSLLALDAELVPLALSPPATASSTDMRAEWVIPDSERYSGASFIPA